MCFGAPVATTPGEHITVILGMFVGAGTFAYLIGAICGILQSFDEATSHYNKARGGWGGHVLVT